MLMKAMSYWESFMEEKRIVPAWEEKNTGSPVEKLLKDFT